MRHLVLLFAMAVSCLTAVAGEPPACASDPAPRAAVEQFMKAMKAQDFLEAYRHVTATMTDGRPAEEWAALQQKMFDLGGVRIGAIDVRDAQRDLDGKGGCAPSARVPNVLHAEDVLNSGGSTEFEIYRVILEDGVWKIDTQETLFQEERIREYFPDDKIPEFGQTRRPGLPGWIRIPKDLAGAESPETVSPVARHR